MVTTQKGSKSSAYWGTRAYEHINAEKSTSSKSSSIQQASHFESLTLPVSDPTLILILTGTPFCPSALSLTSNHAGHITYLASAKNESQHTSTISAVIDWMTQQLQSTDEPSYSTPLVYCIKVDDINNCPFGAPKPVLHEHKTHSHRSSSSQSAQRTTT